ncbi:hypothetical protein BLNAU_2056 [Blattamonas nauphoetae]|uniref:Protein kinase domain-containing protein n=1 Tax=Blattamonas nauphoetae TaxID=2049346 RepID=A0ABQ9YH05_9EUKA|nr:hypothetical protein BLNAU_2056 [Blattamonas nauphoetae]
MLGCVVSLTNSHLSGSTIRDVNTVGCVLCSNSSFSSLLPSHNTDKESSEGTVTRPGQDPEPFMDGVKFEFDESSGDTSSKAVFTNCRFTGANYQPSARPLIFNKNPGTLSVESCSFDNIAFTGDSGGTVFVDISAQFDHICFTAISSNFSSCSSGRSGGAMSISCMDDVLIDSCRFEGCSTTDGYSEGGGLFLTGFFLRDNSQQFRVDGCVIEDCMAAHVGGGVVVKGFLDLVVDYSRFERCTLIAVSGYSYGGGIRADGEGALTLKGCHFIECSSKHAGSAISYYPQKDMQISDTLVKNCHSGATGAIFIFHFTDSTHHSFSRVLFDGNTVGQDTAFFADCLRFPKNTTKFTDVAIMCVDFSVVPTLEFEDCFSTVHSDSSGIIVEGSFNSSTFLFDPERVLAPEFNSIGPLLTSKPTVRVNEKTGKIELEMEGKTPLTSQEFNVTVKDSDGTVTKIRMLFSDGTGTLVSVIEGSLEWNTSYTITSIVGIVPESSSSSRVTNNIEVPVAAWAFNLAVTPELLSFTTPDTPSFSTLQVASAILVESDPQFAFVILHFDKEVSGSYDFVVLEDGEEVTLTITAEAGSKSGATKEFKVVGEGRILTHDTTYTIKSIVPTAESEALFVWMNETIRFHIPKSSNDQKKSLSPETKALLSWLIPLVGCLLIALVLAILIIVLLRRRQKKNAEPIPKEMEAQEPIDVEKVEEFGVDCSNGVLRTNENDQSAIGTSNNHPTIVNQSTEAMNSESRKDGELVEVMACSGDFGISTARMDSTLYSVLHKEHREIGKRGVGLQLVNGLKHVVAHRGWSDVLTRLSSHWILVDTSGLVQLKLQMNASEAEEEAAQTQMQNAPPLPNLEENTNQPGEITQNPYSGKAGMDGLRWRAPEVVSSDGRSGVESVDGHKASIFSLGLVLWEIETGQVPFGELDAVNAQRQSGTGIGLKMESLQNEEFITLILRCVSVDPKDRPTLSEIGEFLTSHPDDCQIAFGKDLKGP